MRRYCCQIRTKSHMFSKQKLTLRAKSMRLFVLVVGVMFGWPIFPRLETPCSGQWTDSFESPATSWWLVASSKELQLRRAQRVFENAIDGDAYERLEVRQRGKKPIQLAHRIEPMLLIDDLKVGLMVKASRAGAKLGARVTLPRVVHPKTGERCTTFIFGDEVKEANHWQYLALNDPATLLDAQLPILRKSLGRSIDPAGAFIDLIVVEDSLGPGNLTVGVDGLTIDGIAFVADQTPRPSSSSKKSYSDDAQKNILRVTANPVAPHFVRTTGGIVEIDDQPAFVRCIECSGESLEFLKSLGFNAVRLRTPPSAQQDKDAKRLGLWLIAPPIFDPQNAQKQPSFAGVIAWDLGDGVGEAELEPARRYIAESRSRHADQQFAFIAHADSHRWEWSRVVDLLITDTRSVYGSTELAEMSRHVLAKSSGGRAGAPHWAMIQTEPSQAIRDQWLAFPSAPESQVSITPQQLRLQAFHAVLGGARGLVFRSDRRLDQKNPVDELRAASLKWVNLQLDMIAPWVATGDVSIISDSAADTLVGSIASDRSTLNLLLSRSPHAQFEPSGIAPKSTSLNLSSHLERTPSFHLTWRGVRQLSSTPSRQGAKVVIERTSSIDFVLIAADEAAIRFAVGAMEKSRSDLAATQLQVASLWFRHTLSALPFEQTSFSAAQAKLDSAAQALHRGDEIGALVQSEVAMQLAGNARNSIWKKATENFPSPLISPFCVSVETLALHSELTTRLGQVEWSDNRVSGGELDSLETLKRTGWLAFESQESGLETKIELTTREPQRSRAAMSLKAETPDAANRIEDASVAITTPGVPVKHGDLIRYEVWVRESAAAGGSKLELFDSLAGRVLSVPITPTADWKPIAIYRFAPANGEAALTVSLVGDGHVDIDSIQVQVLPSGSLRARSGERN
jgi:hypothetical protein